MINSYLSNKIISLLKADKVNILLSNVNTNNDKLRVNQSLKFIDIIVKPKKYPFNRHLDLGIMKVQNTKTTANSFRWLRADNNIIFI